MSFLMPQLQPVGYLFQEARLFSASLGTRPVHGLPKLEAMTIGFDEVVELFGIARLRDRSPRHLFDGERVSLLSGSEHPADTVTPLPLG